MFFQQKKKKKKGKLWPYINPINMMLTFDFNSGKVLGILKIGEKKKEKNVKHIPISAEKFNDNVMRWLKEFHVPVSSMECHLEVSWVTCKQQQKKRNM